MIDEKSKCILKLISKIQNNGKKMMMTTKKKSDIQVMKNKVKNEVDGSEDKIEAKHAK